MSVVDGAASPSNPDSDHMREDARIDLEDLQVGSWIRVRIPLANSRAEFGEDRLERIHLFETTSHAQPATSTLMEPEERVASGEDGTLHEETGHFRGSTLLVFGKFIGLILDLSTQILIVRALSRTEFGAFAFALSVASLAATVALLGLDKTISRFVPLYEEHGDDRRLTGLAGPRLRRRRGRLRGDAPRPDRHSDPVRR